MRRHGMSALVACAWLTVWAPAAASAQEVLDRVLAVASGDVITLSDVRASIELGRVTTTGTTDPIRTGLSLLIDRALILDEVDRFAPPEPPAAAVDAALSEAAALAGSPAAFDQMLARNGIDRAYVRELLRQDLRIRAYLDQRFTAQTPEEQRRLVDGWIAGVRQRADVLDLYADAPAAR